MAGDVLLFVMVGDQADLLNTVQCFMEMRVSSTVKLHAYSKSSHQGHSDASRGHLV